MELTDLRRLTGVNFMMNRPGAIAEAVIADSSKGIAIALWRRHMRELLDAVGWDEQAIAVRSYGGGASLMISAPIDALYSATSLIEQAWQATQHDLGGTTGQDLDTAARTLRAEIAAESNPAEVALAAAASEHCVTFLGNDDEISVGLGSGSQTWADDQLPDIQDIDWNSIHDIPVAMVTGTNGKTTTVRLTGAIGAAAGRTVGMSSSDWVRIGSEIIDEGDYSGPAGARLAVRDRRVDLAVVETARGGLMRRGLPLPKADACLITNVAADHLGTYGINDVATLADAKFLLADAVKPGGRLVLNVDDGELVARSAGFAGDITWYGLSFEERALHGWINSGGHAAFIKDGQMMLAKDRGETAILPVADFAPGLGGAAKYNVSNALGAIALASVLGLPAMAMTEALSSFKGSPDENPGRGNFMDVGGVRVLIDFAHNPHSVAALVDAIKDLPAKRRLFLLSQAGDRSDEIIREMAGIVWRVRPDRIIVKELESMLRGRKIGEIPAVFLDELKLLGAPRETIGVADNEMEAVQQALNWARPGDFLVLLLYDDRKNVYGLLQALQAANWRAGDPVK